MSLRVASAPEGVLRSLPMEKRSPINTQEHWATRRGMRMKSSSLTGSSPAPDQSREDACTFIKIRVGILSKPLPQVVSKRDVLWSPMILSCLTGGKMRDEHFIGSIMFR